MAAGCLSKTRAIKNFLVGHKENKRFVLWKEETKKRKRRNKTNSAGTYSKSV